jgi:hypothetical protein
MGFVVRVIAQKSILPGLRMIAALFCTAASVTAAPFPASTAWTQRTTSVDAGYLMQVSDGIFLTNSHYSLDGITWTPVQYPSHSYWINASGYGGGTFVMTGAVGQIFTSSDFTNWTARNPGGEDITRVVYGNGTFVVRKFWSTGAMWVSKNSGVSWTSVDTGGAPDRGYCEMAFGNGKFIYPLDNRVRTSTDGLSWTNYIIPSVPSGFQMRYCQHFNGERFIGAAESARNGTNVTITTGSSTDGASWAFKTSSITSSSPAAFYSVGAGSGRLLLLSPSAPAEVWLSDDDGSSWVKVHGPWEAVGNTSAFFAMKGNVMAVATDNGIYSADLSLQPVSTLSNLTLSVGALSPTFSSATTSYTASVPNATSSITVTPTVTDETASVQVNGVTVASDSASASIPLAFGTNTLIVRVIAHDGSTTSTYTVTVDKYANSESIAPIVINPIDFGLSASSFSDRVAISGDVVAVNQRVNSGQVHVFQINSNSSVTKLNTITAPDAVYDGPNFGRSLGVVGDVVYAGCHTTFRSGAHDGTAYLFNNAANASPNLVQKWTEFPSQWAGYFGMEGRMVGDTLVVSQGMNPQWGSRGGAFFYRVDHDGSRTSVFSFMDQSTDHYGGGIALSASKCAVIWSPRASPSDCQIRTFDLQRDGSNNLVSVTENAVITAGAAAAGSSSIACDSDLVAMGEWGQSSRINTL